MLQNLPTVEIKSNLCKGCGLCVDSCKPGKLKLSKAFNVLGYQFAEYAQEGCTGCEACFYACPEPNAITVKKLKKTPSTPPSKKVSV